MKLMVLTLVFLSRVAVAAPFWWVPAASVQHLQFNGEPTTGVEFGLRFMSSSAMEQSLRLGLDLRQGFGEHYAAKLGVHLDWHQPSYRIGAAWFFGDTVVLNRRHRQFNGNSAAFSAAYTKAYWQPFIEVSFGNYDEGPGFIFLPRRPGEERLETRAFLIGVEFPLETEAPEWLTHRQP